MHILALETNIGKIKAPFLHPDERELLIVRRHFLQFFFYAIPYMLAFIAYMMILSLVDMYYGIPPEFLVASVALGFFATVFILFIFYARCRFDFIFFTIDKLVVVSSSLLHRSTIPVNLNSVTAVSSETQFFDIFSFGKLKIKVMGDAKTTSVDEVTSQNGDSFTSESEIVFAYAPNAPVAVAKINDIITDFLRRKMNIAAPLLQDSTDAQQRLATHKTLDDKHAEAVTKDMVPTPEGEEGDKKKDEERKKHLRRGNTAEDQQRRRMLQY